MDCRLGRFATKFPSPYLQQLEPCNHLLGNTDELRKEMSTKGFLYIKNFHSRDDVMKARMTILKHVHDQGHHILNTRDHTLEEGFLNHDCGLDCVPFMEGKNDITHNDDVKRVIEGSHVFRFFEKYFGEDVMSFDFKWLRAVHGGGFTGAHLDRVYMSRGSQDLLTLWTPLGDIPVNMGVVAVCEGSHNNNAFARLQETYGNCDLEAESISGSGWFTDDPNEISQIGGKWRTANFSAGDVLIFNIRLLHMSTSNDTQWLRLSCDTRWQPRSHAVDERYVGDLENVIPKYGLHGSAKKKTIDDMKIEWGFS